MYSVASDYLKQGTGYFSMLVPAGTYTLEGSPIISVFNGLSGIGQYATNAGDLSFTTAITAFIFEGNTAGSNEFLTVTTGEAVTINVVTDGSGTFTTGNALSNTSGDGDGGSGDGGTEMGGADAASSGGGGGSLSWFISLLLLPLALRRKIFSH